MRQQSEQHPTDHLHANIKNINKPKKYFILDTFSLRQLLFTHRLAQDTLGFHLW